MNPQQFVTHACRALPAQIRSIILYGSAAAGDFVEGASGYDLLVVVDRLAVEDLDALAPTIRDWRRAGNPLPLLFTPEQLAASADAFAIEFLEMKQVRKVLYGNDPINAISVDHTHVRIHLERELMGKSLALRDRYVLAAGDSRLTAELLTDSLSTFLSLFRTALRLYQPEAPARKLDAMRELAKHISFDPQPFLTVEELKESRRSVRSVDTQTLFGQYCRAIEFVTNAVDRLLQATP
jgi:predicted nucleotidyltransferase